MFQQTLTLAHQGTNFMANWPLLTVGAKGDIMVVANEFNEKVGKLDGAEACLGENSLLPDQRADNWDRLLQLYTESFIPISYEFLT